MRIAVLKPEKSTHLKPLRGMLAVEFLLASIGTVFLFSASWYFAQTVFDDPFRIWRRQLFWMALGVVVAVIVYRMPLLWIRRSVPFLVWIALLLNILAYVPGIGYRAGGAQRWVEFFGLTFQPSELARIALILYLARMLEKNAGRMGDFRNGLLPSILVIGTLILAVYFQNDFSTSAFILVLAIILYFVAGVSGTAIGTSVLVAGLVSLSVVISRPHRLERLRSWFNPEADPAGASYQLLRARIALERGGFWGRGLGQGTVKRGGLPAAHSDFGVAVIGEETGLLGIAIILGLFTLFAIKGWSAALAAKSLFSRWAIFGLVTAVYWQALVNFAVVSGALPATGIPLPLFSAGGSAAFMTIVSFGLIFNLADEQP